jgi:hypothetical protein
LVLCKEMKMHNLALQFIAETLSLSYKLKPLKCNQNPTYLLRIFAYSIDKHVFFAAKHVCVDKSSNHSEREKLLFLFWIVLLSLLTVCCGFPRLLTLSILDLHNFQRTLFLNICNF